jgi:hypothetical protein
MAFMLVLRTASSDSEEYRQVKLTLLSQALAPSSTRPFAAAPNPPKFPPKTHAKDWYA